MRLRQLLLIVLGSSFLLSVFPAPKALAQGTGKCGSTQEDYNWNIPTTLPYWLAGWENRVPEPVVAEADAILEKLNADNIAQTMILILPKAEVSDSVICAIYFFRYMGLGLIDGPRKDNGFVFLIVLGDDGIDVKYAVGDGLPGLTAQNLTPLNRLAEDSYATSKDLGKTILELVAAYDSYARSKYEPWQPSAPELGAPPPAAAPEGFGLSWQLWCCIGMLIVLLLVGLIVSGGGSASGGTRPYSPSTSTPSRPSTSSSSSTRSTTRAGRSGGGSGKAGRAN